MIRRILPFLILFLGVNLFVISYLGQERYIHFWDTSGYWVMYQDFGDLLKQDPYHALGKLFTSIRHDDYSLLPILPMIPFHLLFGDGRLPYILGIVNLYAFPSILLFFFLFKTVLSSFPGQPYFLPYSACLTLSFLPPFWTPVLRGQPDVIGIIIITFILLFYFRTPIEEQTFVNSLFTSLLLVLVVLMRRWYAYWVVSFFIALFFDGLIFRFPSHRFEIKKYMPALRNCLLIGIVSVFLLFLVAAPVAKRMILTDYSDLHSAYRKYGSLIVPIQWIYDYFGFIAVCLFSFGLFFSVSDQRTRRPSLFLLTHLVFTILLFTRTQSFAPQHFYLLIPAIAFFMSLMAIKLIHSRSSLRPIPILVLLLICSINFTSSFVSKAQAYIGRVSLPFSLSGKSFLPPVRNDIGAIHHLLIALDHLVQPKNDSIYVLSSSYTLNGDILTNASRINHKMVHQHILPGYHVDKRDGFSHHFFDAKYVVVGEPIQYHLDPNDQRVVGIPGDQILHQRGMGSSYVRLPYEFALDSNVKVFIYEKKLPLKKGDIEGLMKQFIGYYPDKADIFKLHRLPYEIYDERPKDLGHPLDINYGDKIRLLETTVTKLPENRLEISYCWQIVGELGDYISFVHFTDPKNNILFQDDHAIGPTRSYGEFIGKAIKETHFLDVPSSAVNKEVYVKIGLFSTERGDRLKIKSPKEIPTDDAETRATVSKINF